MGTLVYYSLFTLLVGLVLRYLDGSLEKTTAGGVLYGLLTGLLMGAEFKYLYPYLEKRPAPLLSCVVAGAVTVVLVIALYHVLAMLGIPLG